MKFYVKPQFEINLFELADVITTSPNDLGHNFVDDDFIL